MCKHMVCCLCIPFASTCAVTWFVAFAFRSITRRRAKGPPVKHRASVCSCVPPAVTASKPQVNVGNGASGAWNALVAGSLAFAVLGPDGLPLPYAVSHHRHALAVPRAEGAHTPYSVSRMLLPVAQPCALLRGARTGCCPAQQPGSAGSTRLALPSVETGVLSRAVRLTATLVARWPFPYRRTRRPCTTAPRTP